MMSKKRVLIKWDKVSKEIKQQINAMYPKGFKHKLENVLKGQERFIQVLRFETFDTLYFIEIPFKPRKQKSSYESKEENASISFFSQIDEEIPNFSSYDL